MGIDPAQFDFSPTLGPAVAVMVGFLLFALSRWICTGRLPNPRLQPTGRFCHSPRSSNQGARGAPTAEPLLVRKPRKGRPPLSRRKWALRMKKHHGLKREVPKMTREQLEQLSTGALLARLERLRWCEDSADLSDLDSSELASVTGILFKDTAEWLEAYGDLREILAKREHVPSSAEPRQVRAETTRHGK